MTPFVHLILRDISFFTAKKNMPPSSDVDFDSAKPMKKFRNRSPHRPNQDSLERIEL
jgi:hypothetical protein